MNDVVRAVIVGGGLAGASAAFELRKLGFAGSVTILSEEQHLPYKRPPMSKEYLRGEEPIEKAYVRQADKYPELDITLISGTRATALDPTARVVTTDDGTRHVYDVCLLAPGAAARHLDVPGADLAGVHYLRTADDADAIRSAAATAESVAVIGGGWIGTEVAASLRQLGATVTLIAPPPQPLEHILGAEVAAVYRRLHEENGNTLVAGRVAALSGRGAVEHVVLADGSRIAADLVVAGVGAAPRLELAEAAGLVLRDGGVQVDSHLESSAPGVFVAGDIATAWHPRYGQYVRVEHWDNAKEQGKHAAGSMLGSHADYVRTPYFYSDQFDLGMEYRGLARGWDQVVIRGDLDAREFDAFWLRENRVVAAMNANRWDDAAELQDLVDRRAVVDPEALAETAPAAPAAPVA